MGHSCVRRSWTSFQEGTVNMIKCQCRIRGADLPGNARPADRQKQLPCLSKRVRYRPCWDIQNEVVRNVNDLTYQ